MEQESKEHNLIYGTSPKCRGRLGQGKEGIASLAETFGPKRRNNSIGSAAVTLCLSPETIETFLPLMRDYEERGVGLEYMINDRASHYINELQAKVNELHEQSEKHLQECIKLSQRVKAKTQD